MKSRKLHRKNEFHFKLKMRNFRKVVASGKAKDLIKAGKILADVNQMITKNFSFQFSAKPKNF